MDHGAPSNVDCSIYQNKLAKFTQLLLKTNKVNDKGYFQEPLVVKFSKLNDLDEKLRDIPDENNTENVIDAPHGQLQITLKKTKRVLTKKIGQIKCPFCDEFVLDKSRKKMVVQHVKLIHFSEAETEAYKKKKLTNVT